MKAVLVLTGALIHEQLLENATMRPGGKSGGL